MGIKDQMKSLIDESRASREERSNSSSDEIKRSMILKHSFVSPDLDEDQIEEIFIESPEDKKRGRPKKEDFEKVQKIYPKLTIDKLNYFHKLKSKNGYPIKGDSSRVGYLIEEYKRWDKVRDRFVKNLKNLISKVDIDISKIEKPQEANILMIGDFLNVFGLPLSDLQPYFTKSEFVTLKFCMNYIENRKVTH